MLDYIDPEAQHFIDCITLMFKTTSPMLYIPPALLRRIGAKVWKDHVKAWDGIFNQGTTDRTARMSIRIIFYSFLFGISLIKFMVWFLLFLMILFLCISGQMHP